MIGRLRNWIAHRHQRIEEKAKAAQPFAEGKSSEKDQVSDWLTYI